MGSEWQLLPRGDKKDELEAKVRKAEEALQISSVSLAKALGYKLCKCTFPGNGQTYVASVTTKTRARKHLQCHYGRSPQKFRLEIFLCERAHY
jgi:hypothetical protein